MEILVTEKGTIYQYHLGELIKDDKKLKFIGSGLEGNVFLDGKTAIKIYHSNPNKKVLKEKEIKALKNITTSRIILPREMVFSEILRGYTMPYIDGNIEEVYFYSKDKLLEETSYIQEDLRTLGNNHIFIDDLRKSNYICNKDGFYLIDGGEYSVTEKDCTYSNLDFFKYFFIQDIIGSKIFEIDADKKHALSAYRKVHYYLTHYEGDFVEVLDEFLPSSLDEKIKSLTRI